MTVPVKTLAPAAAKVNGQAAYPAAHSKVNGQDAHPAAHSQAIEVQPIGNGVHGVRVIDGTPPGQEQAPALVSDAMKRQLLLEKLRDDRADLIKVATKVREIAETVETAQITLAITRRGLRFVLLAGSVAALTYWITNGRRSHSTLFAGLSMQVLHRWLKPTRGRAAPSQKKHPPAPASRRARAA